MFFYLSHLEYGLTYILHFQSFSFYSLYFLVNYGFQLILTALKTTKNITQVAYAI